MEPDLAHVLHVDVFEVDRPQVIVCVRQWSGRGPIIQERRISEAGNGGQRGDHVGGRSRAVEPEPCSKRQPTRAHGRRTEATAQQVNERNGDVGVVEGKVPFNASLAATHHQSFNVNSPRQDRVSAPVLESQIRGASIAGKPRRRISDDVAKQSSLQEDVCDDQIRDSRERNDAQQGRSELPPADALRQHSHGLNRSARSALVAPEAGLPSSRRHRRRAPSQSR